MPFQFLCPQGHLLEGIESQMGQQCQCPVCGMMFLVPFVGGPPQPAPAAGYGQPPGYAPPGHAPGYPAGGYPAPGHAPPGYPGPEAQYAPPVAETAAPPVEVSAAPQVEPAKAEESPAAEEKPTEEPKPEEDPNRIVRIPCPQGHELHTPMSMIGMDAMCPECGEQFTLNYEDSIEAREERELKRQQREELFNKRVLQWSIGAAIFVFLGLFTIILIKILKPNPTEETPPPAAPAVSSGTDAASEGNDSDGNDPATDDTPANGGDTDASGDADAVSASPADEDMEDE
jgi:hypothetical protein